MYRLKSKFILMVLQFLALQLLISSCGEAPGDVITEKSGQAALVFVKENSRFNNRNNAMKSNVDEYYPGSNIYILEPITSQAKARNLTKQYTQANEERADRFGHAADPEISYDGKKILFSMKKNRNSRWNLYEMNVDGTGLVQLTDDNAPGHDMDPIYLPNGQIMFASTRAQIVDEYERRQSPNIHVADRVNDKLVNIRQVTFNQSHEINPIVHSSGKIIFSRWEHLGDPNKFSIFVMNPDGTRLFILYGNHFPTQSGSRVYLDPRELGDGGIICTLMERNSPFEGGAIAIKDLSKGDDEYKIITPDNVPFNNTNQTTAALYRSPHPIYDDGEEKIIVSVSANRVDGDMNTDQQTVDYGIYIMDKNGSGVRLIYNDPNYNEIDAVPVLPREELPAGVPQVIPSEEFVKQAISNNEKMGTFFDGNVYHRDTQDRLLRPDADFTNTDGSKGQAKFVRVLAAVALPRDGSKRGGEIGNTNLEKQRVVGYGDIRDDGSFSIKVPANLSVHLQTCDENGMMLVSQRSWTQVMPGEKRLCTGCHDSHNRDKIINQLDVQSDDRIQNSETGLFYKSGFDNPENVLTHSAARPDTVDFFDRTNQNKTNTIQAVFNARCISCHNTNTTLNLQMVTSDYNISGEDNGNSETTVYQRLTEGNNYRNDRDYVTDNGARYSPLLWVMHNRQLDREDNRDFTVPSYDHRQIWVKDGNNHINPFDPANKDLLTLIEWVDMGTQYSNNVTK